jgi:hypothetical protein
VESAFAGSLKSGSRFCDGSNARNLTSVDVKMFSHSIYIIKNCTNFVPSIVSALITLQ